MARSARVRILGVLANQNRLDILVCLQDGNKNASEIVEWTGLTQSAVSHALSILSSSGLISHVPKNRFRYYGICAPVIPPLFSVLQQYIPE